MKEKHKQKVVSCHIHERDDRIPSIFHSSGQNPEEIQEWTDLSSQLARFKSNPGLVCKSILHRVHFH